MKGGELCDVSGRCLAKRVARLPDAAAIIARQERLWPFAREAQHTPHQRAAVRPTIQHRVRRQQSVRRCDRDGAALIRTIATDQ